MPRTLGYQWPTASLFDVDVISGTQTGSETCCLLLIVVKHRIKCGAQLGSLPRYDRSRCILCYGIKSEPYKEP